MIQRHTCLTAILFPGLVSMLSAGVNAESIEIGSRRELFVDYHLIDGMKNVRLELSRPRNEGTVI
ncbi:MAG: hypothetical protein H8E66_21210 [Planctomycetes bacterium]|nr:hypothetical protein [Planctomycetota bacterium]